MKLPRMTGWVAGLLVAALVLTACAGGASTEIADDGAPVPGGTATYAVDIEPIAGGIDPMVATALVAQTVMDQAYETLLTRSDAGEIEPGLATEYEQVDPTTFRFVLRQGVKFADGSDFTAEDVVYTFQTYQAATTGKKAYLAGLESVTADDDHTVTFHFTQPNGTFLNAVAHRESFMIVSSDGYGSASEEERQRTSFGTGPFVVSEWQDGVAITLTRNPHYWGENQPYLDTLVLQLIPDESTRLAAVQQGTVEAAWFSDGTIADQAEAAGYLLGEVAYTQSLPIYINPESGPLSDVRVRRAVSLALDRQALVDVAMFGHGKVSTVVPAGDPMAPPVDADTPHYTRDVAAAKALLAEAGQPNPQVTLSYFGDVVQAQHPIYEVMQQQLAEAGITLNLKATPAAELAPIFTAGETFTDLVSLPTSYKADPTFYFDTFLAEAGAMNHWKGNADADAALDLLARAKAETDPATKGDLLAQLVDEVAEQVLVLVPMAVPQHFELWDDTRFRGYDTDPYGSRHRLKGSWVVNP